MSTDSLLDLLAADAPLASFDTLIDRARAAGAGLPDLAELERQREVALRLRETLQSRRRTEATWQMLNDTAHDLAALHDLDAILQAISERARRLLGCDVAYISLNDESTGERSIRAFAGGITGRAPGIRQPADAGIGAVVMQTRAPYFVVSFRDADPILRTAEMDSVAVAEGLESILGVPVTLEDDIIGVLFAAHRGPYGFAPRDIDALLLLAAHAAVAIDNSRLLSESRTVVAELRAANAVIRAQADELERGAALHQRLTQLVIEGQGIAAITAAITSAIAGTVVAVEGGTVVTECPTARFGEVTTLSDRCHDTGDSVRTDHACAVPMITESESLGALVVLGDAPIGDADRVIVERAAAVAALALVTRRRVAEEQSRVRGELLTDLLHDSPPDHDLLRRRAILLNVDLDACDTLVVAHTNGPPRGRILTAAAGFAHRAQGLATTREESIVLLLPGGNPSDAARTAGCELSKNTVDPVTTVGTRTEPVVGAAAAYREALRGVQTLRALGREGDCADTTELGFLSALLNPRPDLDAYIAATIGPLVDYDTTHRSELLPTLSAFFASGLNSSRAAQALHVHANTVAQRFSRITTLLGDRWREPDQLLEIQIALRLHHARAAWPATSHTLPRQ